VATTRRALGARTPGAHAEPFATTRSSPEQRGASARTGPLGQLDDDPFARLTEADLERLRHDPLELAEELRFGSYWLTHSAGESERGPGRALEVAATVIEDLTARHHGETEEPSTGMRAHPPRPAQPSNGHPATTPPPPGTTPAEPGVGVAGNGAAAEAPTSRHLRAVPQPPPGREAIEVIEAQLVAYTEYAQRLATYIEQLRSMLPAGRTGR
jgi:hypothetical protein